ncbi:MAG: hypothetical protein HY825_16940 [Acidobacteria bacterium]|nr:hypothetical protein [Acidobacteriota bacterium]
MAEAPPPDRTLGARSWTGRCAGCGAELPLDVDHRVVRCAHCGAANLFAGRLVRPVARLRAVLGPGDVTAAVARFARSRDLEHAPSVSTLEEQWIPYWTTGSAAAGAAGRAAIDTGDPSLAGIRLPDGEPEPLDASVENDPRWEWPAVPGGEGEVLRYLPFFRVVLSAGGAETVAWVDRVDGRVWTSAPLNPRRLRFGASLGLLLGLYGVAGTALGLFAPHPLLALGGLAGAALALGWPAAVLARRRDAAPREGDGA